MRTRWQSGPGTPETRAESAARVSLAQPRRCYVAGGLVGGLAGPFLAMARDISRAIDRDDARDVVRARPRPAASPAAPRRR